MQRTSGVLRRMLSSLQSRSMDTKSPLEEVRRKGSDLDRYLYLKHMQRYHEHQVLATPWITCQWLQYFQICLHVALWPFSSSKNCSLPVADRTGGIPLASLLGFITCMAGTPSFGTQPSDSTRMCAGRESQPSTACSCITLRRSCPLCTRPRWARPASGTTACRWPLWACTCAPQTLPSSPRCAPGRTRMWGAPHEGGRWLPCHSAWGHGMTCTPCPCSSGTAMICSQLRQASNFPWFYNLALGFLWPSQACQGCAQAPPWQRSDMIACNRGSQACWCDF